MRNTKNLMQRVALILWSAMMAWCGIAMLAGSEALAQGSEGGEGRVGLANDEMTGWLLEGPSLDAPSLLQVRIGLEEALSGDRGRHLVGEEAFVAHVKARKPPAPACLYGLEECLSATSLAFDALDLALVVRVQLRKSGGRYEAAYTLIDRRGIPSADRITQAASPRDLAFSLVREIYNATGLAAFVTNPPGATVLINGSAVGVTPLEHRLPIGRHQFALQLPTYRVLESSVEVSSKELTRVEVGLELMPARLVFLDAPPGAQIVIDGRAEVMDATQPIELPPGDYGYELRAEGYRSERGVVKLLPGESTRSVWELERSNLLLREVSEDSIANNNYIVRLSLDQSFQSTSFRGARGRSGVAEQRAFERFERVDGDASGVTDPKRFFATGGLRADISYTRRNLGIGLLSLAYLTDSSRTYPALVQELQGGGIQRADVLRVSRVQLRPFQLQYRAFFHNVVPTIEGGLGINFQWITLMDEGKTEADAYALRQVEAFWTLEAGVQYFITPNWFLTARYSFHDHFNLDVGTEHKLSVGVGGAFANLFGVEPEPPSKL